MIPNSKLREVATNGVTASSSFGISIADSAHLMTILRDTLYSDKVLAVLREYSSNAWDAHREIGKNDLPIKITMPTQMAPTLEIQDFGPGLSHHAVFEVYTQYGASTKRDSDSTVGMLGIGSKSGFAYSDSFTITSCHGGTKRTYVAVLDPSEKGAINLLHEEPCGDLTGVTIQIAVKQHDIWEFTNKAVSLFRHFTPRPDINLTLPPGPPEKMRLVHGAIYDEDRYTNSGWHAVMGCVPYRINLSQLTAANNNGVGIAKFIEGMSGVLYFDIGDVQISASREELKYSTSTKKALIDKFDVLVEEFVQHTLDAILSGGLTPWEQRVRAQVLRQLELPIPDQCKQLVDGRVQVTPAPTKFSITTVSLQGRRKKKVTHEAATAIAVEQATRIIVRDDDRATTGYAFSKHDYIVKGVAGASLAVVKKALDTLLKQLGLDGVPVMLSSSLPWTAPEVPVSGPKNVKHRATMFKLNTRLDFRHPWSRHWDVETRVAADTDVFVIIAGFKSVTNNFYVEYAQDRQLLEAFGGVMPPVYSYKSTDKKHVNAVNCKGTEYSVWRKNLGKMLIAAHPELEKMLSDWKWSRPVNIDNYRYYDEKFTRSHLKFLIKKLGNKHSCIKLLINHYVGHKRTNALSPTKQQNLEKLYQRLATADNNFEPTAMLNDIYANYPLLGLKDIGIGVLWQQNAERWIEYIKLVDGK